MREGALTHFMATHFNPEAARLSSLLLKRCGAMYRKRHIIRAEQTCFQVMAEFKPLMYGKSGPFSKGAIKFTPSRRHRSGHKPFTLGDHITNALDNIVPVANRFSVLSEETSTLGKPETPPAGAKLTRASKPRPKMGLLGGGKTQSTPTLPPTPISQGPLEPILSNPAHNQCSRCGKSKVAAVCRRCQEAFCGACNITHNHRCEACEHAPVKCGKCRQSYCILHLLHSCDNSADLVKAYRDWEDLLATKNPKTEAEEILEAAEVTAKQVSTQLAKVELWTATESKEAKVALQRQEVLRQTLENRRLIQEVEASKPDPQVAALKKALEKKELQHQLATTPTATYDFNVMVAQMIAAVFTLPRDQAALKLLKGVGLSYLNETGMSHDVQANRDICKAIAIAFQPDDDERHFLATNLLNDHPLMGRSIIERLRFNDCVAGSTSVTIPIPFITSRFGHRLQLWRRTVPTNGAAQDPSNVSGCITPRSCVHLGKLIAQIGLLLYVLILLKRNRGALWRLAAGILGLLNASAKYLTMATSEIIHGSEGLIQKVDGFITRNH
jgi:hypothetical protein